MNKRKTCEDMKDVLETLNMILINDDAVIIYMWHGN